uniref:Uncharacterized protein n=1 Tax=Cannabis sativa TaxID=3483 RepID=A0A803PDD7_CANSA
MVTQPCEDQGHSTKYGLKSLNHVRKKCHSTMRRQRSLNQGWLDVTLTCEEEISLGMHAMEKSFDHALEMSLDHASQYALDHASQHVTRHACNGEVTLPCITEVTCPCFSTCHSTLSLDIGKTHFTTFLLCNLLGRALEQWCGSGHMFTRAVPHHCDKARVTPLGTIPYGFGTTTLPQIHEEAKPRTETLGWEH